MTEAAFFDTLRYGLWAASMSAAPILGVALGVGLAVGLFQALTSIQEMTLTFVPKLVAIVLTFWVSMEFMSKTLVAFFHDNILAQISGGT